MNKTSQLPLKLQGMIKLVSLILLLVFLQKKTIAQKNDTVQIPALCYHNIHQDLAGHSPAYSIGIAQFKRHLKMLHDSGYNSILPSQLYAFLTTGASLPPKPITDTTEEERNPFVLTDQEISQQTVWALAIEEHYKKPMDIEWAKDGNSGEMYIIQARPETVHSRSNPLVFTEDHLTSRATPLAAKKSILSRAGDVNKISFADRSSIFLTGPIRQS